MIVHKTATHQMTVEFKLLQVTLQLATMNQSPYHNRRCKRPKIQNVKTIHKTQLT